MSDKIRGTNKTAVLCVVALLAAMTLGCSPRPEPGAAPASSPIDYAERDRRIRARRQAFADRKEEFTKPPAKVQLTKEPYIKGKAAFYHMDINPISQKGDWELDNHLEYQAYVIPYEKVIPETNAKMPDEVETVVLQKCQQMRKGNYTVEGMKETIPGYAWNCELTIVDRTIPAVIYRKTFEGDLPTFKTFLGNVNKNTDKVVSPLPREEIYTFLAGLPRK